MIRPVFKCEIFNAPDWLDDYILELKNEFQLGDITNLWMDRDGNTNTYFSPVNSISKICKIEGYNENLLKFAEYLVYKKIEDINTLKKLKEECV